MIETLFESKITIPLPRFKLLLSMIILLELLPTNSTGDRDSIKPFLLILILVPGNALRVAFWNY